MKNLKLILSLIIVFTMSMFVGFIAGSLWLGVGLFSLSVLFAMVPQDGDVAYALICGLIGSNQGPDCDYPLSGGADDRLLLYNFSEVAGYTLNVANTQIVEAITMTGLLKGFSFTGQNFSTQPRWRLVQGPFSNSFEHEVEFLIFNYNGAIKKELLALSKAKLIAVAQSNFKGNDGDAAFHLFGAEAGLFVSEMEQDFNSDVQGAVRVKLKSNTKGLEGALPKSVFITDFAATKTMIDATITP